MFSLYRNSHHRICCHGGNEENIFLQQIEIMKKLKDRNSLYNHLTVSFDNIKGDTQNQKSKQEVVE
jgi:hypothetical protein